MKVKHYNLRSAILVFVLLPLLVISALAGWYSIRVLERQSQQRMQGEIDLVARAIRQPLSYAIEQGREESLVQALDSALRIGRVYGAYVYDAQGNRIGASGPIAPAAGSRRAAELMSEGNRKDEFLRIEGGEDVYSYFLPLFDSGGRTSGLLQVTRRTSEFDDYIARLRIQGLVVLGITALLLTIVVFYGHHKAVGAHVRSMLAAMARIGAGERDQRVPSDGPRELHDLAIGLNQMLENLTKQEAIMVRQKLEQAALEDRLHRSEKMAAIGQLAAGVAHELGTPLNVVDGKAQRALREPDLQGNVTESLEQIRHEVKRMNVIVRQLMDFGRNNPLSCQHERAERLVRAVVAQVGDEAGQKQIELTVDAQESSPIVFVDRLRMEQALSNLLRNALQAATGRVHIGWFREQGRAGFYIDDDGPGIVEADRERIFEPFFTTKSVKEGTGLGLAVADAAVSDHDGHIEVGTSALGGTRMRIIIPDLDSEVFHDG